MLSIYAIIFDPIFFIIAILIVFLYKCENSDWELLGIKDILRGSVTGIILSTIFNIYQIHIPLTFGLLLLIPITFALMSINPKFSCFAYVVPFTYFLGEILETFDLFISLFVLPYREFIILIGFLHIIEGIFIILFGAENTKETPLFNGKKVVSGTSMKKFWPIPLAMFTSLDGSIIPLYTILGYADHTQFDPFLKSRYMGKFVLFYGLFVLIIGWFTFRLILPLSIALLILPIGHELIFFVNYLPFNSNPKLLNSKYNYR